MQPVVSIFRFIWRSTRRAVILVVGAVLLLAGVVMLVTPGPGLLLIVAGFAVLATEFVWAERMLDKAKSHAASTAQRVRGRARARRRGARAPVDGAAGAPAGDGVGAQVGGGVGVPVGDGAITPADDHTPAT